MIFIQSVGTDYDLYSAVGTEGCVFTAEEEGGPRRSVQDRLSYALASRGENHGLF